jgi:hypothetical protein
MEAASIGSSLGEKAGNSVCGGLGPGNSAGEMMRADLAGYLPEQQNELT